jgi:flagellar biosynthesis/type III secretory pathway chaperone
MKEELLTIQHMKSLWKIPYLKPLVESLSELDNTLIELHKTYKLVNDENRLLMNELIDKDKKIIKLLEDIHELKK